MVFDELRRVAHSRLRMEREGHTLSTTALVHEVYLRLADQRFVDWDDRAEFFANAGRAMRRILVDYARRHRSLRRGGGSATVRLDFASITQPGLKSGRRPLQLVSVERSDEILALDEALGRLAELEPRAASVVECRFFAGLSEVETALALGVTTRTVARDWVKARAWLHRDLGAEAARA
jgi:RNA polymerase sigma factor (TIGR02999 family)